MCAIEDADPVDVWHQETRRAAKPHTCYECARTIPRGEESEYVSALYDGRWHSWRTCQHCTAASAWMNVVCGGWLAGGLLEELVEHWHEGYRSIGMGRLIVGMQRRWCDGADQVPTDVNDLARQMLSKQVAA